MLERPIFDGGIYSSACRIPCKTAIECVTVQQVYCIEPSGSHGPQAVFVVECEPEQKGAVTKRVTGARSPPVAQHEPLSLQIGRHR